MIAARVVEAGAHALRDIDGSEHMVLAELTDSNGVTILLVVPVVPCSPTTGTAPAGSLHKFMVDRGGAATHMAASPLLSSASDAVVPAAPADVTDPAGVFVAAEDVVKVIQSLRTLLSTAELLKTKHGYLNGQSEWLCLTQAAAGHCG